MNHHQKKILAVVVGSLLVGSLPGPAFSHGYMLSPEARQSICYSLGGHWNPSSMKSAACKAALENSPAAQAAFDNRNGYTGFAVAPHGLEQAKAGVKDGQLCTGSNTNYAGFSAARSDWTKSDVQPDKNGKVAMTYYYTAVHAPSFIEFYINKKGVDTTQKVLGWDDVELLKRFDIKHGDRSDRHTVEVEIPEDRIGDAIIFTRWQRFDAGGEGFYNCSDVNIKSRDASELSGGGAVDEGDEDENADWIDKGNFITPAHNPVVGETVRFRLMGGTSGDNIVDANVLITAQNVANSQWVLELGRKLNREHSNLLQIGQKASHGGVNFNEQQPRSNQVFVSDHKNGYAIEIVKNPETPAIQLDRYVLEPIATVSGSYSYAITGSSDKSGVNWQWKHVAGDTAITADPANQAKTQIRIPAGMKGGTTATFELTGTSPKGAGTAMLKVTVKDAQVSASGPATVEEGKGSKFTAKANFDYGVSEVIYHWSVRKGGGEVVGGIDSAGNIDTNLAAGDYQIQVVAELQNGDRKATGTASLKVIKKEQPGSGDYETWKAGNTYSVGNLVSWKGVNYIAREWNSSEPGIGGAWKLHNNANPVAWLSTMEYVIGNKVSHKGKAWEASQWIAPGNEPGTSVLWKQK